MSMNRDEAAQLARAIEQRFPELRYELREAAGVWVIEVRNPRTGENFGIVSPTDWQDRLLTMEGLEPRRQQPPT